MYFEELIGKYETSASDRIKQDVFVLRTSDRKARLLIVNLKQELAIRVNISATEIPIRFDRVRRFVTSVAGVVDLEDEF